MALIDDILIDASPVSKNNMRQYLAQRESLGYWWPTVSDMLADSSFSYSSGARKVLAGYSVSAGDLLYEVAASDATDHALETGSGVKLYIANAVVTAQHFGAVGDGASETPTDDGAVLQKFFDYVTETPCSWRLVGNFAAGQDLLVGTDDEPLADFSASADGHWDATITSLHDSEGPFIHINRWLYASMSGQLNVDVGGDAFETRRQDIAVKIEGSTRCNLGRIFARGARKYGVIQTGTTADGNNNNLQKIDYLRAEECGYHGSSTIDSTSNSGTSTSFSQRTVITPVDDVPEWVEEGSLVLHGGFVHNVMAVDHEAGTVTVFPWLVAPSNGQAITYLCGAGVWMTGNNDSLSQFDYLDLVRCPIGLKMHALYGPVINQLHYNSSNDPTVGVGVVWGRHEASCEGGNIQNFYVEGGASWQLVMAAQSQSSLVIGSMTSHTTGLDKVLQLGPTAADGLWCSTLFNAMICNHDGRTYTASGSRPKGASSSTQILDCRPTSMPMYHRRLNSGTLTLNYVAAVNALFGHDAMWITIHGTGSGGAPTGTITWTPGAGQTINGGSSVSTDTFTGVGIFFAAYDRATTNWILTRVSG